MHEFNLNVFRQNSTFHMGTVISLSEHCEWGPSFLTSTGHCPWLPALGKENNISGRFFLRGGQPFWKGNMCCAFRPVNKCFACSSLVEIIFFSLKPCERGEKYWIKDWALSKNYGQQTRHARSPAHILPPNRWHKVNQRLRVTPKCW